jgi:hypothetical protein
MPRYYIAIDDTDHADDDGRHKGTGSKARVLGRELVELLGARHEGITRHQLLVDPAIPYTSHNSSACIVLAADAEPADVIPVVVDAGTIYLREIASPGSDVGLCVAEESTVTPEIVVWGRRAKEEVLSMAEAHAVADAAGIELHGLTGERVGVIGALAAVGLRRSGADGRFLELGGLRQLVGEQPASVFVEAGVERFRSGDDVLELDPGVLIALGEKHPQPVLLDGRATLLIEPDAERESWRVVPRELVKQY